MKIKIFFVFALFVLITCSSELLKLGSQYQKNILAFDKLQKEFRKELSFCDYNKDCFEKNIKDYIETQICIPPVYEEYGFISTKECEKTCLILANQAMNLTGGNSCEEELKTLYDLEEDIDQAEEDLDEAKEDYEDVDLDDKDEEEDARQEYEEAKDDLDDTWKDYNEALREYRKCQRQ